MGEVRTVVAEDAWSSRRRRSRGKPIAGSSTAGALASAAARSGTSSTFPRRAATPPLTVERQLGTRPAQKILFEACH